MKKFDIIIFLSNICNLRCNYCVVEKGYERNTSIENLLYYLKKNKNNINSIKFFGGEPLIEFNNIKYIVEQLGNEINYHIVTNGYFLDETKKSFLEKNFDKINFSLDFLEKNKLDKLFLFLKSKYDNIYINITLNPSKIDYSYDMIKYLLKNGFRKFNILPIYFKDYWNEESIYKLKKYLKKLALLKYKYSYIYYEGAGMDDTKLINEKEIFIDYNNKIYFSDIVENSFDYGGNLKKDLYLGEIDSLYSVINNYDNLVKEKSIILDNFLHKNQDKELANIMNYFSYYMSYIGVI